MGEPQNTHLDDFVIFGRVQTLPNQLFLSLETPGYLKQIKKIPGTFDPRWSKIIPGDPRRDDLRLSQAQMIADDPKCFQTRWSQMIPDPCDPKWSQMIPDKIISDHPSPGWSQMISDDPRRRDLRWFQTHKVPDDPNAIWGLTLESSWFLGLFEIFGSFVSAELLKTI